MPTTKFFIAGSVLSVGRRGHGAVEDVGDAQEVAGELLDRVGARVVGLALGAALGVLGLGGVAERLLLQAGGLGLQRCDLGFGGVGEEFVGGVGRVVFGHRYLVSSL